MLIQPEHCYAIADEIQKVLSADKVKDLFTGSIYFYHQENLILGTYEPTQKIQHKFRLLLEQKSHLSKNNIDFSFQLWEDYIS